jgi:hypothetical protein
MVHMPIKDPSYPVGYLLIWQLQDRQGAQAPNLPTPLSFDLLIVRSWPRGLVGFWLPPLSYFRLHFVGSADLLMSTSKCHFGTNFIFYIIVCPTDI